MEMKYNRSIEKISKYQSKRGSIWCELSENECNRTKSLCSAASVDDCSCTRKTKNTPNVRVHLPSHSTYTGTLTNDSWYMFRVSRKYQSDLFKSEDSRASRPPSIDTIISLFRTISYHFHQSDVCNCQIEFNWIHLFVFELDESHVYTPLCYLKYFIWTNLNWKNIQKY